jgi:hypothetical protein
VVVPREWKALSRDSGVAGEVGPVKGKDVANRVSLHERNKPGVVNLLPLDRMSQDELTPKWEQQGHGWQYG